MESNSRVSRGRIKASGLPRSSRPSNRRCFAPRSLAQQGLLWIDSPKSVPWVNPPYSNRDFPNPQPRKSTTWIRPHGFGLQLSCWFQSCCSISHKALLQVFALLVRAQIISPRGVSCRGHPGMRQSSAVAACISEHVRTGQESGVEVFLQSPLC